MSNRVYANLGPSEPVTMDALRAMAAQLEALPKPPSVIYVRRDAWPAIEARLVIGESGDKITCGRLAFRDAGVRVDLVDWLPPSIPFITDVQLLAMGIQPPARKL